MYRRGRGFTGGREPPLLAREGVPSPQPPHPPPARFYRVNERRRDLKISFTVSPSPGTVKQERMEGIGGVCWGWTGFYWGEGTPSAGARGCSFPPAPHPPPARFYRVNERRRGLKISFTVSPSPGTVKQGRMEGIGGRWLSGKLRRNRAAAVTIVKVSGKERGCLRGRGRTPFQRGFPLPLKSNSLTIPQSRLPELKKPGDGGFWESCGATGLPQRP